MIDLFRESKRLTACSRHEETPRRLVIELTADGADYQSLGDFAPDRFQQGWEALSADQRQSASLRRHARRGGSGRKCDGFAKNSLRSTAALTRFAKPLLV